MVSSELNDMARRVLDTNRYMTLGTVDEQGDPWVTPVYFGFADHHALYWISSPEAEHSRNVVRHPDVSIVVFDSQVPIGGAEAVYMKATAEEVTEPTADDCAAAFEPRFEGVMSVTPGELKPPAKLRLYRARVEKHWVLIRGRDPVWGRGIDSRLPVEL